MLNIGRLAPGGEDYYLETVASGVEDYYTGVGEAPGRWIGGGARRLGLSGRVEPAVLRRVLGGHDPGGAVLDGLRGSRRVPGFDLTFRPTKSVSLLWALSDAPVADEVVAAHDAAVAQALGHLERHAAFSRRGAGGAEAVQVDGFVAAAFRHRSSRAGDPLLHTHVLVANQGQAVDDRRWRTLHSRLLFTHAKTAGYVYQAALRWQLTSRLGVAWGPVVNGQADLAGVDRALIEAFSTRRAEILALLAEWGEWTAAAAQAAALESRRAKQHLVDGDTLHHRWRQQAGRHGWTAEQFTALLGRTAADPPALGWLEQAARELAAPGGLTAQRSTFTRRDVVRAWCERLPLGAPVERIERLTDAVLAADAGGAVRLHPAGAAPAGADPARAAVPEGVDPADIDQVAAAVAHAATRQADAGKLGGSAQLRAAAAACLSTGATAWEVTAAVLARELDSADDRVAVLVWRTQRLAEQLGAPLPAAVNSPVDPSARLVIRRADGRVVAVTGGEPRYSTPELLAVEQRSVDLALAARGDTTSRVPPPAVAAAVASLSGEQAAMLSRLALDRDGVQVVAGPAGSGKTRALRAAHQLWAAAGHQVLGAALAARAADHLQTDTAIPSTTIARLLGRIDRGDLTLTAATVLVVDEAGMVDTRTLHRLLTATTRTGGKLVLVGDPHQLPELAAGGLYAALTRRLDTIRLTAAHRQQHRWDRDALADLRDGDPAAAVAAYRDHDRLTVAASSDHARARLAADWATWTLTQPAGARHLGVMLAPANRDVDDLNRRARALLAAAGHLGADQLAAAGRGYAIGDQVVCTRNQHRLGVLNGTRATVTAADPHRRTLTVATADGRAVQLPGWYLNGGHLAHGYALTDHKAQGLTVTRTWVLAVGPALYREWLYTALSRHRDTARLYLADHDLADLDDDADVHPSTRDHRDPDPVGDLQRRAAVSRAHQLAIDQGTPAPQAGRGRLRERLAQQAGPEGPPGAQLTLAL